MDVNTMLTRLNSILQARCIRVILSVPFGARANKVDGETVKPGKKASEIDAAARKVIEKAGYGPHSINRTGHGLGLEIREKPFIGSTDQTVLRPRTIFTIEPGIYLADEFGVGIEDDILVTADGGETLTTLPREINIQ